MKLLILLSFLVLNTLSESVARNKRDADKEYPLQLGRVVHYANVIKMDPNQDKFTPACAAVILSELWLTGSASCLSENQGTLEVQTAVENYYITLADNSDLYTVKNVIPNKGYKKGDISAHDICLIELKKAIKLVIGKVYPISLPKPDCIPKPGEEIIATKFGSVSNIPDKRANVPLKLVTVKANVIDIKNCGDALAQNTKIPNLFCAKTDKCSQTLNLLGLPATQDGHLMGLLVKSPCSGDKNTSSVYVSIGPYVKWIVQQTKISNPTSCPRPAMVNG